MNHQPSLIRCLTAVGYQANDGEVGVFMAADNPTKTEDVNAGVGATVRAVLSAACVHSVCLFGGPGWGRATLIDLSSQLLGPDIHVGVIAAEAGSTLSNVSHPRKNEQLVTVPLAPGQLLSAQHVANALRWLDLDWVDLLFIKSQSALRGHTAIDVGQHSTIGLFSVAAGWERAARYAAAIRQSNAVILNKVDLLSAVPFDRAAFRAEVAQLNPDASLHELSARTGEGMDHWFKWLLSRTGLESRARISTLAERRCDA